MTNASLVVLLLLCASTIHTGISTAGLRLQLTPLDAKETMAERLSRAARRTNRLLAPLSGVTASVLQYHLDYIAEFEIGSPPQRVQAIVNPMTNIVWTQSSTCRPKCFAQNIGIFNFSRSYTGHPVPCDDSMCAAGYETEPCLGSGGNEGTCPVRAIYPGDVAAGVLRTDMFTLGAARVYITFGCVSQTNSSAMTYDGASGVLGLGRGALSLVSQVGGSRFSYCLTRFSDDLDPSTLFVGSSAGLGGDAPVTSVPFVERPDEEPFSSLYYLPMMGIEFAGCRLFIPHEALRIRQVAPGQWTGGVIIGTSSPFTYLVDEAYRLLSQRVSEHLGSSLIVPSPANGLEFCVAREDVSSVVPPLVLLLTDESAGTLEIPPENYWAAMDSQTSCMLILNSATMGTFPWNETTFIGTAMQQNRHVLFDLEEGSISFQAADCSAI